MAGSGTSLVRSVTADPVITLDGHAEGDRSPAYYGTLGPDSRSGIKRGMKQLSTELTGGPCSREQQRVVAAILPERQTVGVGPAAVSPSR